MCCILPSRISVDPLPQGEGHLTQFVIYLAGTILAGSSYKSSMTDGTKLGAGPTTVTTVVPNYIGKCIHGFTEHVCRYSYVDEWCVIVHLCIVVAWAPETQDMLATVTYSPRAASRAVHHNCCQHILCGTRNAHATTILLPFLSFSLLLTTPLASLFA